MQASKTDIKNRIKQLTQILKERGIDAYLVPTDDFHGSEYVGSYFKCREFMSGFTGSAGTLVVFQDGSVGLYTDGRYFIQARQELSGTGITLYKMGEPGVKPLPQLLAQKLPDGCLIGFDGRVMTVMQVTQIENSFAQANKTVQFSYEEDLVGLIWDERPNLPAEPVFVLEETYAGKSAKEKLSDIRCEMKKKGAEVLLLSALDEIAWLLNIRSSDVDYNPVMLGYMCIEEETCTLYSSILERKQSEEAVRSLKALGVLLKPYDAVYDAMASMRGKTIFLDKANTNFALLRSATDNQLIFGCSPVTLHKAVKNDIEVANMRLAHEKDGVAVTKYLYWLKHLPADSKGRLTDAGETVTERFAAAKLDSFRRMGQHYFGQSFEPIVAAGPHGAIVHYSADEETDAPLTIDSFVLHDTGGQYLEGTTDITRTVCLGSVTDEMKRHFTLVLKGHLRLMSAIFLKGVRGENLDILAREPLWKEALNFNHGTGHGVGYLLNVHEGPNHIRYRIPDTFEPSQSAEFAAGMITSNEPGLYLQGEYGIRHENLMLCVEHEKNEYGQFLAFETLTLVPFDLEAIDDALLDREEKDMLNAYHKRVYEIIGPQLTQAEREWLLEVTAAI